MGTLLLQILLTCLYLQMTIANVEEESYEELRVIPLPSSKPEQIRHTKVLSESITTQVKRHLGIQDADHLSVIPLPYEMKANNIKKHKVRRRALDKGNYDKTKDVLKRKKGKRNAVRRSWGTQPLTNDPPPYLVFNKRIGAYYPYYNFPGKNNVRRSDYGGYRTIIPGARR